MASASIIISQNNDGNMIPGSRDDLVLNQLVTLTNQNNVGATTWLWQLIDKPSGSTASISSSTSASSTFVPDINGTYLIRLTINNGVATDQKGAAVKTSNLHYRIPAASEDGEFNPIRGWAAAVNDALVAIDDGYGDLLGGGLGNDVVTLTGNQTLTHKTIDGYNNTISGISNISLDNSSITIYTTDKLSGGGSVQLGSSITLDMVTSGITAGTYQGIDFDAYGRAITAVPNPGYCIQFAGPDASIKTQINHGFYWPAPPSEDGPDDIGMFWWEFMCCPQDAGSTYMLSDGFGGFHAVLLGFGQGGVGTLNVLAGNFNGTPGTSFTGTFGLKNNEWGVVTYGYDPVTAKIYLFVNGIIYDQFSYTGTRFSTTEVSGGGRRLYIGGSHHSNFSGKIQMYRGAEGGNFPLLAPLNGYRPELIFRNQFYDSSNLYIRDLNLLCDLTQPARVITDLSSGAPAGYQGLLHPGSIHSVDSNNGLDDGIPYGGGASPMPLPQFVLDSTSPLYSLNARPAKINFYPALTPPNGVVAFDSFGGPESSYFYDNIPSLGITEVGNFTWQSFSIFSSASFPWGRRANQAISFTDGTSSAAYITHSSLPADFDARLEIPSNAMNQAYSGPTLTGLAFRVSAYNSFLYVTVVPDGELFCSGIGNFTNWYGLKASPSYPTTYTKIRVTGIGDTLTLYVDNNAGGWLQVFQCTETFNTGVKGYGITNWSNPATGAHPNQMARWQNFSVRSA